MRPRILLPLDDSTTAQQTIDAVIANQELVPRELHLLHVVDVQMIQRLVPDIQKNMIYDAAEQTGNRLLAKLAGQFQEIGFKPQTHLELGAPGPAIMKVAEDLDIQLIIIGRHSNGGGVRDLLLGSVTNYVIRFSTRPILLF